MGDIPESLATPAFLSAWDDWQRYRKERRKKLTPITIERQLAKLAKAGPDTAVAMIEQSIENGWIGLFEVKEDRRGEARIKPKRAIHDGRYRAPRRLGEEE